MRIFPRTRLAALAAAGILAAASVDGAAVAGTIDTIKSAKTIRIAYREDAPPFSYKEAGKDEPTGYIVALCRAVAKKLGDQLGIAELKVAYVPVTAASRFDAIVKQEADLLCEPTTATLTRRERVDFSIPTFVDGGGLLSRDQKLETVGDLAGRKVGVLGGTTTEEGLRGLVKKAAVNTEIVAVKSHNEGLSLIENGTLSAYFADRAILMFLFKDSKIRDQLAIAENYLSVEPYALALAHGDSAFRLAVDTALSHIYRSGEIVTIFNQSFSDKIKPTPLLAAFYETAGLPD